MGLGTGRDLAFGFAVGSVAFDADEQPLIQDGEDARQDGDRGNVGTALELGDERVRRAGPIGDLLLRELKFVSTVTVRCTIG